ncbi:MAG: Uma2 family endonuclease [Caldilineaceae bacterium]
MSELLLAEQTEDETWEAIDEVGSLNHSAIQANLAFLFKRLGTYSVLTDLSLNIGNVDLSKFDLTVREEIKPDVCLYPKRRIDPAHDILRMSEMPLLAVEILSPRQGLYEITEKFKLYFELGVKSCWIVIPNNQTVTVYSAINAFQNFVSGDVVDPQIDIRLPLAEIFE